MPRKELDAKMLASSVGPGGAEDPLLGGAGVGAFVPVGALVGNIAVGGEGAASVGVFDFEPAGGDGDGGNVATMHFSSLSVQGLICSSRPGSAANVSSSPFICLPIASPIQAGEPYLL